MEARRHYVSVGTREVHYRRTGQGPVILAFHSSPQTGAFVLPYLKPFTNRFTVIAPDTPGYGGSDPLPQEYPTIEEYADAAVPFADALGLGKVIVYGTHTGAHIALEFARRHPGRVALCVLDGISFYTDEERKELLQRYAPAFEPTADGGHLAWAWQHTRDQMLFYPWFRWEKDRRLASTMPGADYTHQVVLWKMLPGWGYRKGYQAAFSHATLPPLRAVTVPTIVLASASDILAPMLARVTDVPKNVEVVAVPADKGPWLAAMNRALDAAAPQLAAAPAVPAAPASGAGVMRSYVDGGTGQVLVRRRPGQGRPLVLLHSDMEASASLLPLMDALAPGRPLLALDLPGVGDTDPLPAGQNDLASYRAVVEAVLRGAGVEGFDLYARDLAAPLALELARAHAARLGTLVLDQPVIVPPAEQGDLLAHHAPSLAPTTDGAHLMTAWHRLRDRALFWPWYRRERDAVRWIEPAIDANELQQRLVETQKNPATHGDFARAAVAWSAPPPAVAKGHMLAADRDPATRHACDLLQKAGFARAGVPPADAVARAALLDRLLGRP